MEHRIKIIKSEERKMRHQQSAANVLAQTPAAEAKRDVAVTVMDWVKEYRQRSRLDAAQALQSLFVELPEAASL